MSLTTSPDSSATVPNLASSAVKYNPVPMPPGACGPATIVIR